MTFVVGSDEDTDTTLNVLWQVGSYSKVLFANKVNIIAFFVFSTILCMTVVSSCEPGHFIHAGLRNH